MKERIFNNWKTSAFAASVIIASFVLVYMGKATLTEAGTFTGLVLGYFFVKE